MDDIYWEIKRIIKHCKKDYWGRFDNAGSNLITSTEMHRVHPLLCCSCKYRIGKHFDERGHSCTFINLGCTKVPAVWRYEGIGKEEIKCNIEKVRQYLALKKLGLKKGDSDE